jgi:hypothetical protein
MQSSPNKKKNNGFREIDRDPVINSIRTVKPNLLYHNKCVARKKKAEVFLISELGCSQKLHHLNSESLNMEIQWNCSGMKDTFCR